MVDFNDLALVWGEFVTPGPGGPPAVSVSNWSDALGLPWQRWDTRQPETMPDAVRIAKVAMVNMFHTQDCRHIEQIKAVNPSCYVIACPDACPDIILVRPDWMQMLHQMQMADAIGGRTKADCHAYGTLLNKPSFYLPSPIGPTDWFLPFRDMAKEDYVITLDHTLEPNNTALNVAACAALQRQTGCRVLYAAARDWTPEYARLAGLEAQWLGHVHFARMVELTAKAKICIDMYTRHSYGRQQVLCAMVGTPIFGSEWCSDAPGELSDPYDPLVVANEADYAMSHSGRYGLLQSVQLKAVEKFTFEASRERMKAFVEKILEHQTA